MSNSFSEKYFEKTVNSYLSTVLCIDDQFVDKEVDSSQLTSPLPGGQKLQTETSSDVENHSISIFDLIKVFSEQGLLLTPLNPKYISTESSIVLDNILLMSEKADVIILDWEMPIPGFANGTDLAIKVIDKLDMEEKYHLVIIYTGEEEYEIKKVLPKTKNIEIKVYSKETTDVGNKNYTELAKQIIKEFMGSKKGLLAGATIQSLAALRNSSSSILNDIMTDYDKAILLHRMLLSEPDKTKDFIEDLIKDEIISYLDNSIKCAEKLEYWNYICMKEFYHDNDQSKLIIKKGNEEFTTEGDINSLLEKGIDGNNNIDKKNKETIKKEITVMSENYQMKFSYYSMFISKKIKPHLRNGCIVADEDNYYLCLQPPCDSERVPQKPLSTDDSNKKTPKAFLFVNLILNDPTVDFYIYDNDKYKSFSIDYLNTCSFSFWGNDKGVVIMNETTSSFQAVKRGSKDCDIALRFISCLKTLVAQKFVNQYSEKATHISRVGIDQFEWLRLKGRNNK